MSAAALLCLAVLVVVPERRLACDEPYAPVEHSPDGAWTLTLCRRPMFFAMPGGSGDAPGWLVLRDAHDAIRGVSSLDMVQLYWSGPSWQETVWEHGRVSRDFVVELPLVPAAGPVRRWLDDRIWRLRSLVGLTPSDEELS